VTLKITWNVYEINLHLRFNWGLYNPILVVNDDTIVDNPWVIVDDGQATGKLYHLWLRVECTFFLTHLAFRPCELLPSLFVCRPFVNISHFNHKSWLKRKNTHTHSLFNLLGRCMEGMNICILCCQDLLNPMCY
jgi:hypothetical protein